MVEGVPCPMGRHARPKPHPQQGQVSEQVQRPMANRFIGQAGATNDAVEQERSGVAEAGAPEHRLGGAVLVPEEQRVPRAQEAPRRRQFLHKCGAHRAAAPFQCSPVCQTEAYVQVQGVGWLRPQAPILAKHLNRCQEPQVGPFPRLLVDPRAAEGLAVRKGAAIQDRQFLPVHRTMEIVHAERAAGRQQMLHRPHPVPPRKGTGGGQNRLLSVLSGDPLPQTQISAVQDNA